LLEFLRHLLETKDRKINYYLFRSCKNFQFIFSYSLCCDVRTDFESGCAYRT